MINSYFDNEQLTELEREIKTIPTDGEGRAQPINYDEHFVRTNIIKLIIDLKLSREETAKQKFRFEYTEDLVRKAHTDRDKFKVLSELQKIEIEKLKSNEEQII